MKEKKTVLKYCPNFDKIIHADFLEDDGISIKLVNIYKDYIFKVNTNELEKQEEIKELDRVMGKYVEDYVFRKTLQEELLHTKIKRTVTDALQAIVEFMIGIFREYELECTRTIRISRWI